MSTPLNPCGVVLAGTHFWGGSSLETICPRALLPVAGRPLIGYVLDQVHQAGIRQIRICANSDTVAFKRCLGQGETWGGLVDYHEDPMPRGPAGCARDASLETNADEFLLSEGAILPSVAFQELLRVHRRSQAALTVAVCPEDDADSEHGPAGVYVASRDALELVPSTGYQDIKEMLIPLLYRRGERVISWLVPHGSCLRVDGPEAYLEAVRIAVEGVASDDLSPLHFCRVADGMAHRSAHVDPTARIVGPVMIGPHCIVEAGATLVGPTSLDEGCRIGPKAVVSNAILWSNCHVRSGAIVDHSVITAGARIGAGVVVRDTLAKRPSRDRSAGYIGPRTYWRLEEAFRPVAEGQAVFGDVGDWTPCTTATNPPCGDPQWLPGPYLPAADRGAYREINASS